MFGLEERDFHIVKYFSAQVMISGGRVIDVSEPTMTYCPLADHLYDGFGGQPDNDKAAVKRAIKEAIESKIRDFGLFTSNRKLYADNISVPYGASELMMFALKKRAIEAAVVVCEGAGTVITDRPEVAQGIGARLNSLVVTTPIKGIQKELKRLGCRIVSRKGVLDQVGGVEAAIKLGYKSIAVTVSGAAAGELKKVRDLAEKSGVTVITLVVCTTGAREDQVALMGASADLVWSCASFGVREKLGPLARMQLSKPIPIFVLTEQGVDFVSAYADDPRQIKALNRQKQYLVSNDGIGEPVTMGNFKAFISEARLPVSARRQPCFAGGSGHG